MQSTLHNGLYIGAARRTCFGNLRPGKLVKVAHITGEGFDYWEAATLRARSDADWTKVDRNDLVIPGQEITRDEFARESTV